MLTPRKRLVFLTEWVIRPSCSRVAFSSARAIASCPVSGGRSPRVLNALTTCVPAEVALAISCAPELPSGVRKPVKSVMGLVMSMTTLPSSTSPYSPMTVAAPAYGTARMMMSPAGPAPAVPTVAPPASAQPANALATFPVPMMLPMRRPALATMEKVDCSTLSQFCR